MLPWECNVLHISHFQCVSIKMNALHVHIIFINFQICCTKVPKRPNSLAGSSLKRSSTHYCFTATKMFKLHKPQSKSRWVSWCLHERPLLLKFSVQFYRFPILPINKDANSRPARCKLKWDDFHQSSVLSEVIIFSINTLLGVILQWVHHSPCNIHTNTHIHTDVGTRS